MREIRGSEIAIVMLSRNYASSSWCLDELVMIMKCWKDLGQVVVPIFYKLDSIDVKEQTGDFGNVFRETCVGKTKEDTERWRQALAEVATIAGYSSLDWDNQQAMIEKIATHIYNILTNYIQLSDIDGQVGMEAHLKKMEALLGLESDEARMVGIWGPSGIGKTTIARCLFNHLSHQFPLSVFMENIKGPRGYDEYSAKLQLQKDFLSQILNQKDIMIPHLGVAQDMLKDKKLLAVLDGVDSLAQLDAMAKETRWFGPGSRIIITTQDHKLLIAHGIDLIYEVGFPPPDEALQIFCTYAFGQKSPFKGFENLTWEVSQLASGFPLGLKVMGSYLRGMSKQEWTEALPRLRSSKMGSITKDLTELRQELIITNQDLKEYSSTSERYFEDIIYIYCEDRLQYSFASHLYMGFRRKRIDAFVNSEETLDVLESVNASVVIFSKSCFSSTSYLDMLVRVLQCQRKTGQLVVPVFYGISPSDVVVHEQESGDQIREWSSAIQELRELPGHQSREECTEREFVEKIVKDVYEKLFPAQQIGINSRLLEIEQLLCKQPWGIRRIGIWGMPGIGKTTLAKAVFDQISGSYETSCFIKHFDKAFQEKGLHLLLEEHFGKFFKELPRVCSTITRPRLFEDKLSKKRALVVLDDVHNPLVAESFLRGFHWFGPGSLIIVTSRDKQVFRFCLINHVYEVQSLNKNEAMQLFSRCAFGKDIIEKKNLEPAMKVIDFASGNPLALSFYGKELKGTKLSEMETSFLELKLHTPYKKIHDLLKSSYETLNDSEKNIFLDIACFFVGEDVDYVLQLLEGCGFFPHVWIDVLVEKCLVTISENRMRMHRIIQDFGREVINGETVLVERRSRLWEPLTIKSLLEDEKLKANGDSKATYTRALGTEDIEAIYLDTSNLLFDVKPTAFENMLNLRLLKIYCSSYENLYGLCLPKGLQSLPCELRLLHWEKYPLQSLPQDFDPRHLVELNMSYSQLQKLWRGSKNLDMLKMVRLCHSQQLTEIDDICKAQNIELIDLRGCTQLRSFPATGQLYHLRVVYLSGCTNIKSFPEVSPNIEELGLQRTGIRELKSIRNATNLKKLYLTGCASLVELLASIGDATNLEILDLGDCSSLITLPFSIENATNLKELNLGYCSKLVKLLSSIGNVTYLKKLCLDGCLSLVELPSSIGNATNLQELNLGYCLKLVELPSSIGNATNLQELNLDCCSMLVKLPLSIGNLTNLKKLCLFGCSSLVNLPSSIGKATNLQELNLDGCSKMVELPSSIGNVTNLKKLCLVGCSSMVKLPFSIGNFTNLQELNIGCCSKLVDLPSSIGNAITNLQELNLSYCLNLMELPSSIGFATNLKKLCLVGCSSLVELPFSIQNAIVNLQNWNLGYCSKLVKLSYFIGFTANLQELNLEYCSSLVELPLSIGSATNLKKLCLVGCSSLMKLPPSIWNATNLQELNLEYCSSLVELPSSFENAINLKTLYLTGCSSLVELPSSIRNSTSLISIDLDEDNILPIVTFSENLGSRCIIEVRRAKRRNFLVLKGEQKNEHSVSLVLHIFDENGRVRDVRILFNQKHNIAPQVSSNFVVRLKLTEVDVTFIAEMIAILLVNMIPTWKPGVTIDHLIDSQLYQNSRSHQIKAKTQRQEETAFHDACESVSYSCPQSVEEDTQCVDAIKVEDGSSNQEAREATEPASLKEEEMLRQELEEIEAKYQNELKKIVRKKEEAIMETKKRRKIE